MKKLLAIVISMAMIVAMMPAGVFADVVDPCSGGNCTHPIQVTISGGEEEELVTVKHCTTLNDSLTEIAKEEYNGKTFEIKLLKNVNLTEKLTISKNITLDVGEHNLSSDFTGTGAAITIASNTTVNIKGSGNITGANGRTAEYPTHDAYLINVRSGANLTLYGVTVTPGATTTESMTSPATKGVYVFNGTLNLNNATVNGGASNGEGDGGYGVYVFQSGATLTATDSTITGGALNSNGETNCKGGAAIYLQGGGNVNLTNCNITGGSANKTAENYRDADGGSALWIQNSGTVTMTGGTLTGGSTSTTARSGDGGNAVYTPGGSTANLTFSGVTIKGGDSDNGDGGSAISLNGPSTVVIQNSCSVTGGENTNGEEDCGGAIGFGYSGSGSLSILNSSVSSKETALSFSKEGLAVIIEESTISGDTDGYSTYLNATPNGLKAKNSVLLGKVYIRSNDNGYKDSFTKEQLAGINNGGDNALVAKVNNDYYFGADKLTNDLVEKLNKGDSITIYNGVITMTNVPVGVAVTNYGSSNVIVNGQEVETNKTYIEYEIIYELNGGTAGEGSPVKHTYGKETVLVAPTKTGYTFNGWYADSEFSGNKIESLGAEAYTEDITLYAKWTVNKYTVTFNSMGGSSVDSQKVEYNKTATKPATDPIREGYDFTGWHNGNNAWEWTGVVTGDMTLIAHWTKEGSESTTTTTTTEPTKDKDGNTTTTTTETVKEKTADGNEVTTTTVTEIKEKVEEEDGVTTKTTTETVKTNNTITGEKETVVKTEKIDDDNTTGTKETTTETVMSGGDETVAKTKITVVVSTTEKTDAGTIDTEKTTVTVGNTTNEVKKEEVKDESGNITKTVNTETETVTTDNEAVTTAEKTVTTTENGITKKETVKTVEDTTNKVNTEAKVEKVIRDNTEVVTTKVNATINKNENEEMPETVKIDATKASKDTSEVAAAEVTLPKETVSTLKSVAGSAGGTEQVKTVEVKTDVATLKIDNTALQTLTNTESSNKALTLTVEKKSETKETESDVKAKFELKALLGGNPVFQENDKDENGTIAISVDYEKSAARNTLVVYYVKGDGSKTPMPTRYTNGVLTWETNHFSTFEVVETVTSGGGGYVAPTADTVVNSGDTTTDTVKPSTTTAADGTKTVTATVSAADAKSLLDKAVSNKSKNVVINTAAVTETAAGTTTKVDLPEQAVKAIAEQTEAAVTIKTGAAEVTLDKEAVNAVAEQAGDTGTVKLVVKTVNNDENLVKVDLELVTSEGIVSDFRGGSVLVKVKLNAKLAAKDLVCLYIDDGGIYHKEKIEGNKNDDGTFTFRTGHFSEYAIMAADEADKAIADQLDTLIKEVSLKVKTTKTSKKNIKVTVSGDVTALTDAGYTVKYRFCRSTKASSSYVGMKTKDADSWTNTAGIKGTKYYYKAKVYVYDENGDKVGQTKLSQCKYSTRTWSKK